MKLLKSHGLGNDYLVLESGETLSPAWVRALCDRNRGIGADGVLEPIDGKASDYGVRIWNPDGSIAEKSGNGLRIFAQWLVDERAAPAVFTVFTGTDEVSCRVGTETVTVAMGRASFRPQDVPVEAEGPLLDGPLVLSDGEVCSVVVVGVGNPHCVLFGDEPLDDRPWRRLGQRIECHPQFPNRTNVQFARVLNAGRVEIRIWERGAGETLASGSSSCAVAAAGVRTGRLTAGRIEVLMPGGVLHVTISDSANYRW